MKSTELSVGKQAASLPAKLKSLLSVPQSFILTAKEFPDKIDAALALVDSVDEVLDLHAKTAAMEHYAHRVRVDTKTTNYITYGRLKIEAKVAELMPAKSRQESGAMKGKGSVPPALPFSKHTIVDYRKVKASEDKLDDYRKAAASGPDPMEMSTAGFIRFVTGKKRSAKDAERAAKERAANRRIKRAKTIQEVLGNTKFSTIVVDPPWDWKDEGDNSQFGRGKTTYGALSHEQLLEFPLGQYGDSHIYLWITNRSLPKGFSLLEAWDYRYVTCLTWCKPSIGMGNYFRGSTEHLLFGIRGSLSLKRKDAGTWFSAPRGKEHSAKPDGLYDLVESCSPGPYLDVFSRRDRVGWVCWGGELS